MFYKSNSYQSNKNTSYSTGKRVARFAPAFSLMALLGYCGVFWLADQAIKPTIAQAAPDRISLVIDRQVGENYQALISRAEVAARAAAQRRFDSDILINEVSVIVIGSNQGLECNILSLNVTRNQWKSRPDPKQWAKYFPSAQALLKLDQPTETTTTSAPVTPPAATTPASSSSDRSNSPPRPPGVPGPGRANSPISNPTPQPGSNSSSGSNPISQPSKNSSPSPNPTPQPGANPGPGVNSGQQQPMIPDLPDLPGIPEFPGIP